MKVIGIFWAISWLGMIIQELLKEEYASTLKSPYLCFLDVPSNFDEYLLCELSYKNRRCFIATFYGSSSQSREEFTKFLGNFEVLTKTISNLKDPTSIIMFDLMHDHQTGINMTHLTMKEYKLTPSL